MFLNDCVAWYHTQSGFQRGLGSPRDLTCTLSSWTLLTSRSSARTWCVSAHFSDAMLLGSATPSMSDVMMSLMSQLRMRFSVAGAMFQRFLTVAPGDEVMIVVEVGRV